jgi:hypothetical protein
MDTPSGNTVRTDTFTTTPSTTTISNYYTTNTTQTTTITNDFFGAPVTNTVITTNVASQTVTNIISGTTNIVDSGAAAVVSGVLGFGISDGTPATNSTGGNTVADASGTTLVNISLENNLNYFVVYVDGDVFAGQTAAGINLGTKKVAGTLWNGTGRSTYERVDNPSYTTNGDFIGYTTTFLTVPGASAGGYFNAKIKSDKSPFTFKGAGEISTRSTSQSGDGNATYPFNLDGIKVSDN